MAESKYGKYIITDLKPSIPAGDRGHLKLIYLDDEVIKGAFYVECAWIWPGCELYPSAEPEAHTHDFDEVITFFGTNPEDPHDLCGEIELWLEDEKHILTKSCLVFIPKGMKHCPLIMRRVDRPIFHFAAGPGKTYIKGQIQYAQSYGNLREYYQPSIVVAMKGNIVDMRQFTIFKSAQGERVFVGGSMGLSPVIEKIRAVVTDKGYDAVIATASEVSVNSLA